jgi:hypothetical protein
MSTSAFASRSIAVHLVRGMAGALSLAAVPALPFASAPIGSSLVAAGLLALTLVAWRGCPMCWVVGLTQTIANALRNQRDSK